MGRQRVQDLQWLCAGVLAGVLASCAVEQAAATGDDEPERTGQAGEVGDTGDTGAPIDLALRPGDTFALTTEGIIRGTETATMRSFRGIPYAAPPVGDLRWQPTQRAARHRGVLDATQVAAHCPQGGGPFGIPSTTEDCLFLNVFTPRHLGFGLKPVMVWIHGGGLTTGRSDNFNAAKLVEQGDVIVVTLNYRLGVLGFLAHPALTAESPDLASGNYGLMDQQEALRWVQRNILLFGGDPFRVTLFGESAGGLSVHSQLAAPSSKGLFQRAIVESGTYQLNQPTLATAEATGSRFATAAGCTDQTAGCLRSLSVEQILATQPSGLTGASPTIDNKFLTQSVRLAFINGAFNRVPILEGTNHDEWRLFVALTADLATGPVTPATYAAQIQSTLGIPAAAVPLFTAQYPLASFPTPDIALGALGTDGIFACNARFLDQKLSQFVPVFAYEFNDQTAPETTLPPVSFSYGAAHATEIRYIFNAVVPPELNDAQRALSDIMVAYWTTFARTGQPNSVRTPVFPQFSTANDTMQSLGVPDVAPETGFAVDHHCAFWDSFRQ